MTAMKREGDGATPMAVAMRPQQVWYRADRVKRPVTQLPVRIITKADGWCDAPDHPAYNSPVKLPFAASHETMMRDDVLYDICVVLDFNRAPMARKRHGGSAIFLHCAKPGYMPTAGCIAVARSDLAWMLGLMNSETVIRVLP